MRIALAGTLLLCLAWPAEAQDCHNLTYLTGVPITVSRIPLVPVSINQKPAQMILDTGGVATQIARPLVEAMGLHELQSPLRLSDASGHQSDTPLQP